METMDTLQQFEELEKKRSAMVRNLIDKEVEGNKLLVQKSSMGSTLSYMGSVSFSTIAEKVRLFTELDLFTHSIDEKGRFIINEGNVAELEQRAPNFSRQSILTYYLLKQRYRLFPPLVVCVSEPWINNPDAPEWENKVAVKTSLPVSCLDSKNFLCLLDLQHNVLLHVLDGSHRLLGIKGVHELWQTGRLMKKSANGTVTNSFESKQELLERFGLSNSDLENLILNEQVGVMFVPAVMEGETREEARRRVRSIFVHINKTAQPPTSGEQLLLDEDDGFSIIARKVGLSHPLFQKKEPGDRVNWKSKSIPARSTWLTPGATIKDCVKLVLSKKTPFDSWTEGLKKNEIPVRPPEHEIEEGLEEINEFYDLLIKLPTFKAIKGGADLELMRAFPTDSTKDKNANGNLLLRPIGQEIIAATVGDLAYYIPPNSDEPLMSKEAVFKKLVDLDANGFFEKVYDPKSPWYGVTFDPKNSKMIMNAELGTQLLSYVLGGLPEIASQQNLLERFRESRLLSDPNQEIIAYNLEGKKVSSLTDISLPSPL